MIISNFSVTPSMVAPGESMLVSFTVTVEAGDTVNGLSIVGGLEQRVLYFDNSWRLGVGQSAQITFENVVPTNNKYINSNLAASSTQQFTVPYWYVVLGQFGSRVDIPNPVTYVDKGLYPVINAFTLERAADGNLNDEGENVLASIKLSTGRFANTSVAYLRLYYKENGEPTSNSSYIDLSSYIPTLINGVTDNSTIITRTFANSSNWVFKLVFGDADESTESLSMMPRSFANVHLSGDERGGVCFGGFSHGRGTFECHYPSDFYGGIEGVTNFAEMEVPTGGTWIDGKPIYRQIVSVTATAINTWYLSSTIENVGAVVKYDIVSEGTTHILNGAIYHASSQYVRTYMERVSAGSASIRLSFWTNHANHLGKTLAIVYYTKIGTESDEGGSDTVEIIRPAAAMTSASSQGCVASASTENSSSYAAWKAFNKSNSDAYGWASKEIDSNKWIQLKMDVALKNITVTIRNRSGAASLVNGIVSGTIMGSNDGSTWTTLCTISGRDGATIGKSSTHECNNQTAYSYVRIKVTSSTNNSYVAVGEIEIKGY